jgi:hypothetical protein
MGRELRRLARAEARLDGEGRPIVAILQRRVGLKALAAVVVAVGLGVAISIYTTTTGSPQPLGKSGSWTLAFDDEFSDTAIDYTKWTPTVGAEGSNWQCGNSPVQAPSFALPGSRRRHRRQRSRSGFRSRRARRVSDQPKRRRRERCLVWRDPGTAPGQHRTCFSDLYGTPDPWRKACSRMVNYPVTPQVGLEPTTLRLTAGCSAN